MTAYSYTDAGLIERANAGKVQTGPPQHFHRTSRAPKIGEDIEALCGLTFRVSILSVNKIPHQKRCPYCFPERPRLALAA